jgi:hypothetical protein
MGETFVVAAMVTEGVRFLRRQASYVTPCEI